MQNKVLIEFHRKLCDQFAPLSQASSGTYFSETGKMAENDKI